MPGQKTTTAEIRALLRGADGSDHALARQFGISRATVRKWRQRSDTQDRSHAPHRTRRAVTAESEILIVRVRKLLQLPLDELLLLLRETLTPTLSRSTLDRLLRRHAQNRLAPNSSPPGIVRLDAFALHDGRVLFVGVDAATAWTLCEVRPEDSPAQARAFLKTLQAAAPFALLGASHTQGREAPTPWSEIDSSWLRGWLATVQADRRFALDNGATLPDGAALVDLLERHRARLQVGNDRKTGTAESAIPAAGATPPSEPPGPRRRGRPISVRTRESILDAAENLFASHGYNGVSIRDITKHANVRKSLAAHHFGSKEELFQAVLNRRALDYTQDLRASLDRTMAMYGKAPATVEDLLRALATPILRWLGRDESSGAYVRLLAQISAIPGQEALLAPYRELYAPVTRAYVDELRRALPALTESGLNWSFYFVEAAFVHIVTESCLLEQQTQGLCRLSDHASIIDNLVPFFSAGFRAMAAGGGAGSPQKSRHPDVSDD